MLPVPSASHLLGLDAFVQSFVIVLGANDLGIVTSDGIVLQIGN